MKNSILSLIAFCLIAATLPLKAQVKLNGHLSGLKADSISFNYQIKEKIYKDRIAVKDGIFNWQAKIDSPLLVTLKIPIQSDEFDYVFFAERGEMKLRGGIENLDSIFNITTSGTPTQALYQSYVKERIKLINETMRLDGLLAKSKPDSVAILNKQLAEIGQQIRTDLAIRTIEANPKNFASLYLLQLLISNRIDYDIAKNLFTQLAPSIQSSSMAIPTRKDLAILQRSAIGQALKPFSIPDQKGKTVALADYKGKILLVDFWASWCAPCRAENPNLLKNYQQYQAKGFDIVGISCDTDVAKWEKAVEKDQLPWKHIRDWEILKYYGITGIPANFLVDGNGKILGINLIGEALSQKLDEIFKNSK